MSKINILGIINAIKSKTNVYSPIIEAVVNSIEAIQEAKNPHGEIIISVKRDGVLELDESLPKIVSIEIQDNGIGFNQKNRDSFDTFYSFVKRDIGGKGFGRFIFLKYFDNVGIESTYKQNGQLFHRKFTFGKEFDIIVNESNRQEDNQELSTVVYLNNYRGEYALDKQLETIARKLLERLLFFFINPKFNCPKVTIREGDGSHEVVLNEYLAKDDELKSVAKQPFFLNSTHSKKTSSFEVTFVKIYYAGSQKSKICLTAGNREVVETTLHSYVPEFEDDFYDEFDKPGGKTHKNYIIKAYVQGGYLDENVDVERESFNFEKEKSSPFYEYSQSDIESKVAEIAKNIFSDEVISREEKKKKVVREYVTKNAPWHRPYLKDIDYNKMSYFTSDEKIELELQKIKFRKEQETRIDIQSVLDSNDDEFESQLNEIISKITEIGKNDLAHYVCNRKVVLKFLQEALKRREDGKGHLEKEVHQIIFPMGKDSEQIDYEDHNLWLLDERLVFSEYIASDKKISNKALAEPDLLIFDKKQSFRSGDNEFSNPLTIIEFKRPKREEYTQDDDPILQIGKYLQAIREGKYELPEGLEKIKVNENTPIYGYIISDIVKRIDDFATQNQLTKSPDNEGYFGFHNGYRMYIEILSYKKLLKDATLRNKIFFKKLNLE